MNYYNDNEPFAADWLRGLIDAGLIPRGEVNEASIQEAVHGGALRATQAHFFAGIGGWPLALRIAGYPDHERVWTASLPCQPWSAAGKGLGEADERHLWPVFKKLVARGRPPVILGEQVASKAGRTWLAGVRADLEELGYRFGAVDLCAAGVGSPNIRQRLFWVADLPGDRLQERRQAAPQGRLEQPHDAPARRGLAQDAPGLGRRGRRDGDQAGHEGQVQAPGLCPHGARLEHAEGAGRGEGLARPARGVAVLRRRAGGLADAHGGEPGDRGLQRSRRDRLQPQGRGDHGPARGSERQEDEGLAHRYGQGCRQCRQQGRQVAPGREPDRRREGDRVDDAAGARHDGPRQGAEGEARDQARLRGPQRGRREGDGLAHELGEGRQGPGAGRERRLGPGGEREPARDRGAGGGLGDADVRRLGRDAGGGPRAQAEGQREGREDGRRGQRPRPPGPAGRRLAHAEHHAGRSDLERWQEERREADRRAGPWGDCVLVPCSDGTARRIGRGVFPLAHGLPRNLGRGGTRPRVLARLAGLDAPSLAAAKRNRIGRLKGYGNAINPWAAAEFIMAYLEARGW